MPIDREPPAPPRGGWGRIGPIAVVVLGGLVAWGAVASSFPPDVSPLFEAWLYVVDPALGVIAGVLTIWRRRYPQQIALSVTLIGAVSTLAGGAVILTLASVATRRRWRELIWLAPLNVLTGIWVERMYPSTMEDRPGWLFLFIMLVLMVGAVTATGVAVGGRRELARERVESAQRDQARRIAQAAAGERTRIAREMHDVLAHRISLVAMHAGALNYRTDLPPEQMAQALKTIESNAHQALADLREVLGVLREQPSGAAEADGPQRPQPGFHDIPALVVEVVDSGMRVDLSDTTSGEVPVALGRAAYRVVQEALTNARKHSPGARVTIGLSGAPSAGLRVAVSNPRAVARLDVDLPTSGLGLLGLQERVNLAGGTLRHGTTPGGGYAVDAWLPWPVAQPIAEAS